MGKYEEEIMCLERIFVQDKFSTTALDLEEVEKVVAKAEAEIEDLKTQITGYQKTLLENRHEITQLQRDTGSYELEECKKDKELLQKIAESHREEIAKLQREKAELEKEVARLDEIVCEDALLKSEHNALVERVKVHNKQFEDGIALYEGRPELQFVQALLSKNLISLD